MKKRLPKDYRPDIAKYRGCLNDINGWFTEEDAKEYKRLVSEVYNGNIIEIGSYEGLSLYHIKDICKEKNIKLYSVDFIAWPKLVENTINWGIEFIQSDSVDASKQFEDGFFDLIFIDGDHHKKQVIYDIWSWLPKLKREGTLAGHDFVHSGGHSVQKALQYVFGDLNLIHVHDDVWSIKEPCSKVVQWK